MMFDVTVSGDVCEVVLNRPEKRNALTDDDFLSLRRIVVDLIKSPHRALLFYGAGGAFSAGRDIGTTDPLTVDAEKLISELVNPLFRAIASIEVPTIAAIEGPCLGGGFGIAFSCDIVLAAENARIGSAFRNLGAVPDSGIHYFLRSRLGYHRASELLYTGRMLSGSEAARIGLINQAFPDGTVIDAARAMAAHIAAGPTKAFKASKRILCGALALEDVLKAEAVWQGKIIRSQDAVEGFSAFQQRRKPKFVGN